MDILNLLNRELNEKGKSWTTEEKARYLYIRSGELFSYDPRYIFCNQEEKKKIRNREFDLQNIEENWIVCTSHAEYIYGPLLLNLLDLKEVTLCGVDYHLYITLEYQEKMIQADIVRWHDLERIKMKMKTEGYTFIKPQINHLNPLLEIDKHISYIKDCYTDYWIQNQVQKLFANLDSQSLFSQEIKNLHKIQIIKKLFENFSFRELMDASYAIAHLQRINFTDEEREKDIAAALLYEKQQDIWNFVNIYRFSLTEEEIYYQLEKIGDEYRYHEVSQEDAINCIKSMDGRNRSLFLEKKR